MERCLPIFVLDVHLCLVAHEALDDLGMALACGPVEGCLAIHFVLDVDLCLVAHEALDALGMAIDCGLAEGGLAIPIVSVDIDAGPDEGVDLVDIVVSCRIEQLLFCYLSLLSTHPVAPKSSACYP